MTIGGPVVGRVIRCTRCGVDVDVIEASLGARTSALHEWIDAAEFVCGGCLDPEPLPAPAVLPVVETPSEAVEAASRARTAQQMAARRRGGRRDFGYGDVDEGSETVAGQDG